MLYSVLATLAIVVLVIMLNPASRPELYERTVDVPGIAGEATAALPYTALAPQVPEDWRASYARLVSGQGSQVQAWEAGYVTAAEEYAQFVQTDQADPTWLSQAVDGSPMTGTRAVRDVQWDLYEKQGEDSHLVGELNGTTVVVTTSAGLEDLDTLAAALVDRAAVVASETSPSPSPSTSAEG